VEEEIEIEIEKIVEEEIEIEIEKIVEEEIEKVHFIDPITITTTKSFSYALLVISATFLTPAAASTIFLLQRNPASFNRRALQGLLPKPLSPQSSTAATNPDNKKPRKEAAAKKSQIVMSSAVLAGVCESFSLCNGRAFQYFAPLVNIKLDSLEVLFQKFNSDNKVIFLQITQAGNVVGEAFGEVVEDLPYGSAVKVKFNFQDDDADDEEEGVVLLNANVQHCINVIVVCSDVNDSVHLANVPPEHSHFFNVTTGKLGMLALFHNNEVSTVPGNLVFSGTGKFQEPPTKKIPKLKS
ncbi:MAG: hypothetical protein FWG55_00130, partial [Candidatus Bathyarchaeota archaeon]|nr:hypothetical protein [Candidatus Termiticorpusculum sp.]